MRDIIIFGAGDYGNVAYHCFQDKCHVVAYIDNDAKRWGTRLNGVPITSPDVLKEKKYPIMIAVKHFVEQIKKQLHQEYGIEEVMVFSYNVSGEFLEDDDIHQKVGEELIVHFMGGLGNQMFQYVIYRILKNKGINVTADLSYYISPLRKKEEEENLFVLQNVFPHIVIRKCKPSLKEYYMRHEKKEGDKSCVFSQQVLAPRAFDSACVLKMKKGWIKGWFQSYKFAQLVATDLYSDFAFDYRDEKLKDLVEKLKNSNYVSVHVRRGGYVLPEQQHLHGDGCNTAYYDNAMSYIRNRFNDIQFCFFSDDIQWVRENYNVAGAIYVESKLFDAYQDWYDMCLMSFCKHNIVANSTFSWWGAYLNQNPDKIVIAPRQWFGDPEAAQDMCPPEWVRM